MKTMFRSWTSRLLALAAALVLLSAQGGAQAQPAYTYSQQELDQMLAPIALYPDPLLSQILMAATYPMEVIEAARWSRDRPGLAGDDAVRTADAEDWDPSVKSLLAFPQVLARMGENLQWTQSLGDAFLEQEPQVMDTVQALRRRAQAEGNLRSDDRVSVIESGPSLLVQPYNPRLVYVPYYDPQVVYGSWWWPASPPMYLRPWPGYYARPAYAGGFYWGPPVGISLGFFFGAIDWRQRQVRVVQVNNYYYRPAARQIIAPARPTIYRPAAWQHDPDHRRGLGYRGYRTQQRFGVAAAPAADAHRYDRGMDPRRDARYDVRRPETRTAVETRPIVVPAAAAQPAPQASVVKPAPAPQTIPAAQRAPEDTRFDHRREMRGPAQPAPVVQTAPVVQPPPVMQSAPVVRPAPIVQSAPVIQSAPVVQPAPVIQPASVAQPASVVRPAHVVQPAPVMQSGVPVQPVLPSRGERPAARIEPGARHEPPRAPQPHMEVRAAPEVARQPPALVTVVRQEPPARQQPPQAGAPRVDARAEAAAARVDSGVKVLGRPRMDP